LPYRPDLVGFMSNVRGVGRNIHPFWEVEVFLFLFFSKQKVLGVFIVMILLIFGVFLLANYDF
jgi:hypothetical protein